MPLHIDEQTTNYLSTKNKPLYIKLLEVNNCCAPAIQELMIHYGVPKDIARYNKITHENIPIYIRKPLNPNDSITLRLRGFGIFKYISAHLS